MPYAFRSHVLPNGLEIVAELEPAAHTAAAGFFMRTGARDEDPRDMGVSHFLEHMMFKGSERRSAEQVDRDFDAIGARHNAYTSNEHTAYWAHCLPEHLPAALDILADILRPALRDADFESERKVILEEIAMYRDNPFWVLYERALEAYYGDHPLAHRVLGTDETVGGLPRDRMERYFRHRYSADNTVLSVAGRIDFDAIVKVAEGLCGAWERTNPVRDARPPQVRRDELDLHLANVHRHYAIMLAPAPAADDEARYAAALLAQILGDVDGSKLYWSLIEPGIADEAQASFDPHDGTGNWFVYLSCDPDRAEEAEAIARRTVDGLLDAIDDDDLLRHRAKIATAATLAGELPAGRMKRLGRQRMVSREYRSLDEELARIAAVTLDDLHAVAARFPLQPKLVARLGPEAG